MKRLSLLAVAFAALFAIQTQLNACGYGLLDPDVETYCSGDPVQAAAALANLVKRGPKAAPAIEQYRSRAVRQQKSYERYLTNLQSPEGNPDVRPENLEKEIERAKTWLKWNEERMQKIDFLFIRLGLWPQLAQHCQADCTTSVISP